MIEYVHAHHDQLQEDGDDHYLHAHGVCALLGNAAAGNVAIKVEYRDVAEPNPASTINIMIMMRTFMRRMRMTKVTKSIFGNVGHG